MLESRPTIKDVAARAGVSRQTVSRVLNDKGEISDETRARVLAAIQELGYRPSAVARSMVAGNTHTLGCISPNLTDYTLANIIEGAQAQARSLGYFVLTASAPAAADVELLLEEMMQRQVDGLLILNPLDDDRHRYLEPLIDRGLPVTYLNNTPHDRRISSVRCDDREGGQRATHYLVALGHRAIATIVGRANEECAQDRLAGYEQALQDAGLDIAPEIRVDGDWSATSGYRGTVHLLQAGVAFSALFAQNDQMAVGAIRALREAGKKVPDDVSVIGFDDIPLASYFDPPLTTLRQPMQESGRQAARLLVDLVQNPGQQREQIQIQIHAQLVERASCAAARTLS